MSCPSCGLDLDFIPKLPSGYKVYWIHSIPEHMFARCCIATGSDPQSGPFYCGAKAKWLAALVGSDHITCACQRHEQELRSKQL
jgi:hypothetical protein